MINIQRYNELKAKVDADQRQADKAQGALDNLMSQLEQDFGCKTLAQAEKEAQRLSRLAIVAEDEYNEALAEFEKDWADGTEEVQECE